MYFCVHVCGWRLVNDYATGQRNIISEIISQKTTISVSNQMIDEFKNLVSVEEMKRVYKLFKQFMFYNNFDIRHNIFLIRYF